ncbi:MAG: hypothetical protein B9S38_12430 [Verrucomicrobiia bacterium Tous-C4TDCM]|nr:MAG: hypothetical protein B9S38_12430 [Verrucomicrobiae bacterium Tous-C4TDCM]
MIAAAFRYEINILDFHFRMFAVNTLCPGCGSVCSFTWRQGSVLSQYVNFFQFPQVVFVDHHLK